MGKCHERYALLTLLGSVNKSIKNQKLFLQAWEPIVESRLRQCGRTSVRIMQANGRNERAFVKKDNRLIQRFIEQLNGSYIVTTVFCKVVITNSAIRRGFYLFSSTCYLSKKTARVLVKRFCDMNCKKDAQQQQCCKGSQHMSGIFHSNKNRDILIICNNVVNNYFCYL